MLFLVIWAVDVNHNAKCRKDAEQFSRLAGFFSVFQIADKTDSGIRQASQLRLRQALLPAQIPYLFPYGFAAYLFFVRHSGLHIYYYRSVLI